VTLLYLDTSVALAHLLAEDRHPPPEIWGRPLVSSRLIEYELWVRLNALQLATSHGEAARDLLGRIAMVELHLPVLARALEPFPVNVRTLDALHLATVEFLRGCGQRVELASYDERLTEAARKLGIRIAAV
jgi:predicted nucleic acid-binding protein